jgi:hypothetical protein
MKTILPALAFLVHSSVAWAAGYSITWDDCVGGTTPANKNFNCTANADYNLHIQFRLDQTFDEFVALTTYVNYQNPSGTLTPFWQFQAGGCQLAPSTDGLAIFDDFGAFGELPSCGSGSFLDPWGGDGSEGHTVNYGYGVNYYRPGNGYFVLAVYRIAPVPLWAGQNYWAFNLNFRTIHRNICPGCSDPGTISIEHMILESPNGPALRLEDPDKSGITVTVNNDPTPARATTWGLIKSLYR